MLDLSSGLVGHDRARLGWFGTGLARNGRAWHGPDWLAKDWRGRVLVGQGLVWQAMAGTGSERLGWIGRGRARYGEDWFLMNGSVFHKAVRGALNSPLIVHSAQRIMLCLLDAAAEDGTVWLSIQTIATRLRMDGRNVTRNLTRMVKSGHLSPVEAGRKAPTYQIDLDKLTSFDPMDDKMDCARAHQSVCAGAQDGAQAHNDVRGRTKDVRAYHPTVLLDRLKTDLGTGRNPPTPQPKAKQNGGAIPDFCSIGDAKGSDLSIAEQTVKAIENGLRCPPLDAEPESDLSPVMAALDAYHGNGGRVTGKIRADADRMAGEWGDVQVVEAILWAMAEKAPIAQAWARVREKTWSQVRVSVKELETTAPPLKKAKNF